MPLFRYIFIWFQPIKRKPGTTKEFIMDCKNREIEADINEHVGWIRFITCSIALIVSFPLGVFVRIFGTFSSLLALTAIKMYRDYIRFGKTPELESLSEINFLHWINSYLIDPIIRFLEPYKVDVIDGIFSIVRFYLVNQTVYGLKILHEFVEILPGVIIPFVIMVLIENLWRLRSREDDRMCREPFSKKFGERVDDVQMWIRDIKDAFRK